MERQLFTKFHGDGVQIDWIRVVALREAAVASGFFEAPAPISLNLESKSINYELLPVGTTMYHILTGKRLHPGRNPSRDEEEMLMLNKAGCSLAFIHNHMKIQGLQETKLSLGAIPGINRHRAADMQSIIDCSPKCCGHGDFCLLNVFHSKLFPKRIFILDPIPAVHHQKQYPGIISIYADIGMMISSIWGAYLSLIFALPGVKYQILLTESFVTGYEKTAGTAINRAAAYAVALKSFDEYWNYYLPRSGLKNILFRPLINFSRRRILKEALRYVRGLP